MTLKERRELLKGLRNEIMNTDNKVDYYFEGIIIENLCDDIWKNFEKIGEIITIKIMYKK